MVGAEQPTAEAHNHVSPFLPQAPCFRALRPARPAYARAERWRGAGWAPRRRLQALRAAVAAAVDASASCRTKTATAAEATGALLRGPRPPRRVSKHLAKLSAAATETPETPRAQRPYASMCPRHRRQGRLDQPAGRAGAGLHRAGRRHAAKARHRASRNPVLAAAEDVATGLGRDRGRYLLGRPGFLAHWRGSCGGEGVGTCVRRCGGRSRRPSYHLRSASL